MGIHVAVSLSRPAAPRTLCKQLMVSLLDPALSPHGSRSLTSPRVLVALARLGLSPEELEHDLQAQVQDKSCDPYSKETRHKLDAVKHMTEFVDKYGVTEEEGSSTASSPLFPRIL